MSTSIHANYSQFYRGSETIKTHGSGNGGKDTIVRYEFNTTDAHGNKIMDKMSKEETMKTMNEITSQYGDNVIVEFSGDCLAALEAHKGMGMPKEHREIPEGLIKYHDGPTQLTEEQLIEAKQKYGHDTEAQMRAIDPKSYNEYQKLKTEGLASGTQEGMTGFMRYAIEWVTTKEKTDSGWAERANASIKKDATAEEKLSTDAQKYLDTLRKKYGDFDFLVSGKFDTRKGLLKNSTKEFSVIFSIDELERMARDEKYAEEKMRKVQTAVDMSKRICQEFGYERGGGENGTLSSLSITFNNDGSATIFAELEKTSEKQRERIEAAREKKAEEKKAAEKKEEEKKAEASREKEEDPSDIKRITIAFRSDDGEEGLIQQLKNLDWDKV